MFHILTTLGLFWMLLYYIKYVISHRPKLHLTTKPQTLCIIANVFKQEKGGWNLFLDIAKFHSLLIICIFLLWSDVLFIV